MQRLSQKQEIFCQKYVEMRNGLRAAIAAGYSPAGAGVEACRMLKNPKIISRIEEIKKEWFENADITKEQIINELKSIAFQNLTKDILTVADEHQQCLPFEEMLIHNLNKLEDRTTRAISDIVYSKRDGVKLKTYDKLSALKLLSEIEGYSKNNNVEVNMTVTPGAIIDAIADRRRESDSAGAATFAATSTGSAGCVESEDSTLFTEDE